MEDNQPTTKNLYIHKTKGEAREVGDLWEIDVYLTYEDKSLDDTLIFQTREDLDEFMLHFKKPTLEPMIIPVQTETNSDA